MALRIPAFKGLDSITRQELQQTLRQINQFMDKGAMSSLDGAHTLSAQHRRLTDLQRAISPRDAIPLAQFMLAKKSLERRIAALESGRGSASGGGGSIVPPPPPPPPPPPSGLPSPNHILNFGYYFTEFLGGTGAGDGFGDILGTFNTYYAVCKSAYDTTGSDPPSVWIPTMAGFVSRAFSVGLRIQFLAEFNHPDVRPFFEDVMIAVAPYFGGFRTIEVANEPSPSEFFDADQLDALAIACKSVIDGVGLPAGSKNYAFSLSPIEAPSSNLVTASQFNRVGANLYLVPPGGTVEENKALLEANIDAFLANVPLSKQIQFSMQAYDRSGLWTDITTLTQLQYPYYLKAYLNTRVRSLFPFSYYRSGGTAFHPELRVPHLEMWNALHPLD